MNLHAPNFHYSRLTSYCYCLQLLEAHGLKVSLETGHLRSSPEVYVFNEAFYPILHYLKFKNKQVLLNSLPTKVDFMHYVAHVDHSNSSF